MENFNRAYARLREARDKLEEAIKKDFPLEATVFYDHGHHERQGKVVIHGRDRVCIETFLGKRIWIDAYRIKRVGNVRG